MAGNDSIYRLLAGLAGSIKTEQDADKPTERVVKESEDCEDALLATAMQDVRRLDHNKERVLLRSAKPSSSLSIDRIGKEQLEEALRDHRRFNVKNLPEYMEGFVEGINPMTIEKLRNGEFSIQGVLDLHGYSVAEARDLFDDFLQDATRKGLHCIKVIHGRGLKSRDIPVLKEKLKRWIVQAMHRRWIVAFCSARMCEGGPGATCILLRDRPEKRRIRVIG